MSKVVNIATKHDKNALTLQALLLNNELMDIAMPLDKRLDELQKQYNAALKGGNTILDKHDWLSPEFKEARAHESALREEISALNKHRREVTEVIRERLNVIWGLLEGLQ